jgi:XisI protein
MDKARRHREVIEELLREYSTHKPSYGEVEVETIIDSVQGHYQLMNVGWHGQRRVHGCVMHIDVIDGKIWIQHDGTEDGVANRLVAAGVPKNEIVLGFQSPFQRRHTEFSVG